MTSLAGTGICFDMDGVLVQSEEFWVAEQRTHILPTTAPDDDIPVSAVTRRNYREVYDDLRSATYITYHGDRGITLDQSNFDVLADVLYHECNWEPWEIDSRLKHYEGIDNHDWA